jgi:LysM repeat protein
MYGNSDQYSNQQQGPQQYGSSQDSGPQQYGSPQDGGQQQYGGPQDGGSQQYGGSQGGGGSSCSSIYKIAAGENLTTIASANGVSVDALVEANNIDDPNMIVEGQALCIPGGDSHGDSYGSQGDSYSNYPSQPGESYDPNAYHQGGDSSSQPQQYGPQESSNSNYPVKPGESYDPSAYNNQGGQSNQGSQPEQYGPQSYGTPEPSYSEPEYGSHEYDSHESEPCVDMETYHGTPGKSYDPSYVQQSYPQCEPVVHITATPVATATPPTTDGEITSPQPEGGS